MKENATFAETPEHSPGSVVENATGMHASIIVEFSTIKIRTSSRSGVTTILEKNLEREQHRQGDVILVIP
eukprot:5691672-Amphidinium_carterae.1